MKGIIIPDNGGRKAKRPAKIRAFFREHQLQHFLSYAPIQNTILGRWLSKLFQGILILFVQLKYVLYQWLRKIYENKWKILFRAGFSVLAIIVLFQKDVQFSFNMKSPMTTMYRPGSLSAQEDGNAHAVALRGAKHVGAVQQLNIHELDDEIVSAYIKRFSRVATVEMEKFGIPASLKMAQGILGSGAGEFAGAQNNYNHFGAAMSNGIYDSAWENWRAHSLLLQNEYKQLFSNGRNYKKWAEGLQAVGYSKDQRYAEKLLEIIEKYQLYILDEL